MLNSTSSEIHDDNDELCLKLNISKVVIFTDVIVVEIIMIIITIKTCTINILIVIFINSYFISLASCS